MIGWADEPSIDVTSTDSDSSPCPTKLPLESAIEQLLAGRRIYAHPKKEDAASVLSRHVLGEQELGLTNHRNVRSPGVPLHKPDNTPQVNGYGPVKGLPSVR